MRQSLRCITRRTGQTIGFGRNLVTVANNPTARERTVSRRVIGPATIKHYLDN